MTEPELYDGLDIELSLEVAKRVGIPAHDVPAEGEKSPWEKDDTPFVVHYPQSGVIDLDIGYYDDKNAVAFTFNLFAVDEKGNPTPAAWASFGVVLDALATGRHRTEIRVDWLNDEIHNWLVVDACLGNYGDHIAHKNLPAALALAVLKMGK